MEDINDFEMTSSRGPIKFRVMHLENGLVVFISGGSGFRLGPTVVSIPASQYRSSPTSTGLLGSEPDSIMVRIMAERIAAWTNRACMVVATVNDLDRELTMEILNALKDHLLT
ncbi:MAG: proteasome assembly chaperone 4 family protein [Candidatus Thorarchaeota archaeon]